VNDSRGATARSDASTAKELGVKFVLLALVGVSHHNAPIDVRERLSCPPHALPDFLDSIASMPGISEAAVLSTCNRMEVYVVSDLPADETVASVTRRLAAAHDIPEEVFAPLLTCQFDQDCAAHLFRVASGLDSLVLGESQILGQVRFALRAAQARQTAGKILNKLFEQAIATGKRAQTETGLGRGGFSIGHAAVDLASRIFDDFAQARILILGAGKMSEVTARHLVSSGVKFVVVANRTFDRALVMAERLGGTAIHFDEAFRTGLVQADIVISSTAAPHAILHRDLLQPLLRQRRGRPLFLIDIALPRDIDPDVNELDNVFLYNIDDLQSYVQEYALGRASEAGRAAALVAEEAARFGVWYRTLEAAPVINALRVHLEGIRQDYMTIFSSRLTELSDRDRQILDALSRAMMDQVAREPIARLKEAAVQSGVGAAGDTVDLITAVRELFGLEATAPDPSAVGPNARGREAREIELEAKG